MSFNVSDQIQKLRKEKGLTQEELANAIGIKRGTLAQYESGKRNPKKETLEKFAEALNVHPACFRPISERMEIAAGYLVNTLWAMEQEDEDKGKPWKLEQYSQNREAQMPIIAKIFLVDASELSKKVPSAESLAYANGAVWVESKAKQKARWAFQKLPNDWHKDTAINWQMEILRKKMGKNYNNAMFEALMQLYQDDEPFTQEFAERLEELAYNLPATSSEIK